MDLVHFSFGAFIYLCARAEITDVQMHEVDLLLECILNRDGQASLPGWFSRSHVQTIVDYICTVCSFVIFKIFSCLFLYYSLYTLVRFT